MSACVRLVTYVIDIQQTLVDQSALIQWCQTLATVPALAQILGNNECFEPYTSNIYVRRVLSGEFTVVNQHLLMDLTALGLWNADMKNELVAANGSVQARVPASGCCHAMSRSAQLCKCIVTKTELLCLMRGCVK